METRYVGGWYPFPCSSHRLDQIRAELEQIRDQEATKLFRLARKADRHGCPLPLCVRIRSEAWVLKGINPEQLLNPFISWEFAFKMEGHRRSSAILPDSEEWEE